MNATDAGNFAAQGTVPNNGNEDIISGLSPTEQSYYNELAQEDAVREKLRLARDLVTEQRKRTELISQIVQNLSMAGWGENQDQYKRLISGALGVKPDDVEGVLPDIANELEEGRVLENAGA